jgi:hypothetical protein
VYDIPMVPILERNKIFIFNDFDELRKMAGSIEYSDEPARMDDIYQSIRENPPVSNVTTEDEIARKNQRLLNTAISSSRVAPTTVDSTNIEDLFASGINVAP